jgi:coniferyl-aldehyde dehydrogenase
MAPQKRSVAKWYAPASARVVWQPLGVVGIIAPWNYPILLAAGPLVGALAAGNRVLIKTSEHAPETGAAFAAMIAEAFADDHVSVIGGEADVAQAMSALPFDHLLFTGSTLHGRSVMRAAADHLTPVTLELGGKSPAIIGPDADIEVAAARIMTGKCSNAGQTCVAPDYVLIPADREAAFIAAAQAVVARRYPRLRGNPDYTTIISDRHFERLRAYLDDARALGARVVPLHARESELDSGSRTIPPLAILNASDEMHVMNEEIFGPLLPIVTYRDLGEAIAYVNARPRPLALYYFGDRHSDIERVIAQTTSGGVTLNDTMLHVAQDDLPFGGVGPSGMGAYHGRDGFERFSHKKSIFAQSRRNLLGLFEPPYGVRFDALFKLLMP